MEKDEKAFVECGKKIFQHVSAIMCRYLLAAVVVVCLLWLQDMESPPPTTDFICPSRRPARWGGNKVDEQVERQRILDIRAYLPHIII